MRYLLLLVAVCYFAFSTSLFGQELFKRQASNAVYVEALGSAKWYSINYERFLGNEWSVRLGTSLLPNTVNNGFGQYRMLDVTVPLTLNYLLNIGRSAHNIEFGVGAAPTFTFASFEGKLSDGSAYNSYSRTLMTTRGIALVGYRFQPIDGGLMFRVTFTPSIEFVPGVSPPLAPPQIMYGGVSIGYAF